MVINEKYIINCNIYSYYLQLNNIMLKTEYIIVLSFYFNINFFISHSKFNLPSFIYFNNVYCAILVTWFANY